MRLADWLIDEVQTIAHRRRADFSTSTFQKYELRTLEFVAFLKFNNPPAITFSQLVKSLC